MTQGTHGGEFKYPEIDDLATWKPRELLELVGHLTEAMVHVCYARWSTIRRADLVSGELVRLHDGVFALREKLLEEVDRRVSPVTAHRGSRRSGPSRMAARSHALTAAAPTARLRHRARRRSECIDDPDINRSNEEEGNKEHDSVPVAVRSV